MNLYANYGRTFIPFRLKQEATPNARCSLGGDPPTGVMPGRVEAATRYLATLGLEDGVDVSLFSTFDYASLQNPFNFFRATYKLHDQSNAIVQFVVHQQMRGRDTVSPLRNPLPALGFVFGAQGVDPACPTVEALGNPAICSDHKVGGQPCFSQLEGEVGATLALLRSGYVHLLQIAFPSSSDTLTNTDWPFGESIFHVFAKKNGNVFEFSYIWA